ncbi:lysophospholipase [Kalaharituber pfeilii]|nr:lysophospholipase [Kalaharituber pfeilii]
MIDFDVATFMDGYSPNIGLAFSGGGYRAMLNGGGVFKAFDSRTPGSTRPAHMGGLVQAATYIAGLSGGSWMLGSVVVNNFTTIQALQDSEDLWDLENSILAPEGSLQILDTVQYYGDLRDEVMSKRDAGYEVSLTDYWARALSRQFIAGDGGPAITFSSISRTETFRNFEMPFPIIVADERHPGEIILSVNATVFEFNPLEMGSFDPTLFAFTPLEYIGSNVTNGKPDDPERCTKGFDNASFLMGTSSSLFNIGLIQLQSSGLTGILRQFAEDILNGLAEADADIADYSPNPFYKVNPNTNPSANERRLTLVDGGLDGQNIPLQPLIQPARALDVIFAVDSSADTSNWPNGTSLVATYARSLSPMHNRTGFPAIPDQNTFVNLKLNTRPTFFGCDAKNLTGDFDSDVPVPPLIVYIPNHPYTYMSNISTFDPDHDRDVRDAIIENGYNVATMGNGTVDNEWAACAGCAIVRRGEERRGRNQTEQCRRCFDKYCWDGTRDERTPDEINYTVLIAQKSAGLSIKTKSSWTLPAIVAAAVSLALI